MYGAIFNSINLGISGYEITSIDVAMPKNKVNKFELVQSDGQVVTSRFYGERVINVKGRIIATDFNDMQSKLDNLKVNLDGYEKFLDISIANTNRRYVATVQNFNYSITGYFCEFDIAFTCNSIGSDFASTSLTMGTYTTSPTSYTNTITGTYYAEPSFDFTVNRVVPFWSAGFIEYKNAVRNERMRITRTWLPEDRVVIDGKRKTVSVYASSVLVIDSLDSITSWTATNGVLTLDTTLEIEGTGCSNVAMGSAATSSSINRLNVDTNDFSSTSGKVLIPIFIPTPTSGSVSNVRFITGSDATLASNFCEFEVTSQWNGAAITSNAWNYFVFDLSTTPTSTTGTPSRTAIKSISVRLGSGSNFQLNGWKVDYMVRYKASITPTMLDYEGTIPSMDLGSSSIIVTDEFTLRDITKTGSYIKRYL